MKPTTKSRNVHASSIESRNIIIVPIARHGDLTIGQIVSSNGQIVSSLCNKIKRINRAVRNDVLRRNLVDWKLKPDDCLINVQIASSS